ncbi:phosphodiester glycosidase family protein [Bacteroides clarus]|jgi:exopolysaccharide biosynthesis protein|uniref:phosphodiester glycosidase family protein n=1 Tax=Bacteroides clarus TaxID=626929 RepID=UPI00266C24EF|nr:phosphodiester glycosidase family protein [Bacteroides clarus]
MRTIKFYKIQYLLSVFLSIFVASCEQETDGIIKYEAFGETEAGKALVNNTSLVATVFSDSTYSLENGVDITELHYFSMKGYSMKLFIMEVDLTEPNISVEVTTPNNKNTFGFQPMTEQAIYENTDGHQVLAGINGDFFNTTTGVPNGILYKEGTMIKDFTGANSNFFAVLSDRKGIVGDNIKLEEVRANIQEGIGGGVRLVRGGILVSQSDETVNPRTCLGVDETGNKIIILEVDGRNYHYSNGMTYEELGQCMLALGAYDALNLDGGGSSTFFIRDKENTGNFLLRNWPCDNGGKERAVANGLVVIHNQ